MNNLRPSLHSDAPEFSSVAPDQTDIIGIFSRGWSKLLLGAVAGIIMGLAVIAMWPAYFQATAQIIIERGLNRYLQANKVVDGPSLDDDAWSQLHIISSEDVLMPVVRKLNLANDPEFVGKPGEEPTRLQKIIRAVKSLIRPAPSPTATASADDPEQIAFRGLAERMWSTWESQPSVIQLNFRSKDAVKAARIANAIAESYADFTAENRQNSAKIAGRFIQERLSELKDQATDAERKLIEYKIAHNVGASASSLSSEQMKAMSSHLISARIAMLDAKARMEGIAVGGSANANSGGVSDLLTRLKDQYVQTEGKAREMEARVGSDHDATIKLNKQLEEIRTAIKNEQKRIADSYTTEYEYAKTRYDNLAATIEGGLSAEASNYESNARLRELESAAETYRGLYNSTLQRYSEAIKTDGHLSLPDARVLTRASVPQQPESKKLRYLIMAANTSLGLLLAGLFMFIRNNPLGVYRTTDQVKRSLGLQALMLPRLTEPKGSTSIHRHVLKAPFSRYSESMRIVWSQISAAQRGSGAKVFSIVSSVSNEGKSTVAANLAAQIAAETGLRVLLIDGDPHHHRLSTLLAPNAEVGLLEALDNGKPFETFVYREEGEKLAFLPCPRPVRKSNSAQLLGSRKMETMMAEVREAFDIIIVETPPLAVTSDSRMFARFCDAYIMVIEWGVTSQSLTIETLQEFPGLWERVLCVVLNKADPRALDSIESYKGSHYHSYYVEAP